MPYITLNDRFRYDLDLGDGRFDTPESPGPLNYQFTRLITTYLKQNGTRYQQINDILGALEGAKMEFYRRVVVPYEDQKKHDNGDVYV